MKIIIKKIVVHNHPSKSIAINMDKLMKEVKKDASQAKKHLSEALEDALSKAANQI